jgi:hypothetical protein
VILRLCAALAWLAGTGVLLAYLTVIGEGPFAGPAARHLRAMKDRAAPPAQVVPISYEEMRALPHRAPPDSVAAIERRGVSIEGYVEGLLRPSDGDIHFEVAPTAPAPDEPNVAYVSAELTPAIRRGAAAWTYDGLARAFRVRTGATTAWERGPRRARISGWLMFDYQYDTAPGAEALRSADVRMTGWEIHPVTRIELWDDSLGRFVALAR